MTLIHNISDTARWAAVYRARETERPDALFRDPFARRLAGERGEQIADGLPGGRDRHAWAWVMRTVLFDQLIQEQLRHGVDRVVNLAAGLDARPYRMPLPPSLTWIEVDLPEILAYKEGVLKSETPACALERVRLDLSNAGARSSLLERLGHRAGRTLVLTEGLLTYLSPDEVASLARDLAARRGFDRWLLDFASPGLLRLVRKEVGAHLGRARAELKFGPEEGPGFFTPHGWRPIEVRSLAREAVRRRRAP